MRVAIIGQGYVGLPLALAASQAGHTVVGIDSNPQLVSQLAAGKSPILDITDGEIDAAIKSGSYGITSELDSIKDAEIVVI